VQQVPSFSIPSGNAIHTEQALAQVHRVFDHVAQFVSPDVVAYNTLLKAYGQVGDGTRAVALLAKLEDEHESDRSRRYPRPDATSYISAMQAVARDPSSPPAALQDLLQRMHQQGLPPDTKAYTIALDAWARSNHPVTEAYRLLQELWKYNAQLVDFRLLGAFLQACWGAADAPEAMACAHTVMDQVLQSITGSVTHQGRTLLNHTVVVKYLTVIGRHGELSQDGGPSDSTAIQERLLEVYRHCHRLGHVSRTVAKLLTEQGVSLLPGLDGACCRNVPASEKPMAVKS
jgi:pentatricopeptide repeat protein